MLVNLNTKKRRNSFYKKLLKVVCKDPCTDYGLCYYIGSLVTNCLPTWAGGRIMQDLPELNKQKPKDCGQYWYSRTPQGWRKRIACVEKAIELTN
jgi:hypothetical protein